MGGLREGASAQITVTAFPNVVFSGTVKQVRINPTTVQNVVTYDAVLQVHDTSGRLLPGMTAQVTIQVGQNPTCSRCRLQPFSTGRSRRPRWSRRGRSWWRGWIRRIVRPFRRGPRPFSRLQVPRVQSTIWKRPREPVPLQSGYWPFGWRQPRDYQHGPLQARGIPWWSSRSAAGTGAAPHRHLPRASGQRAAQQAQARQAGCPRCQRDGATEQGNAQRGRDLAPSAAQKVRDAPGGSGPRRRRKDSAQQNPPGQRADRVMADDQPLIEVQDLTKVYGEGPAAVQALKGVSLPVGTVSSWPSWGLQDPANPRSCISWAAWTGPTAGSDRPQVRKSRVFPGPAGHRAREADRLRVPELQPPLTDERAGECRAAHALRGSGTRSARRKGRGRSWSRSGWARAWTIGRTSFPAASSSGSPSRGRLPAGRPC